MFTGIITGVGRIAAIDDLGSSRQHGKRLTITAPSGYLDDVGLGDSIALNGACMTVTSLDANAGRFTIDISAESLDKTAGLAEPGPVNLEKALVRRPAGGHRCPGTRRRRYRAKMSPVGESGAAHLRPGPGKYLAYLLDHRKGSAHVNSIDDVRLPSCPSTHPTRRQPGAARLGPAPGEPRNRPLARYVERCSAPSASPCRRILMNARRTSRRSRAPRGDRLRDPGGRMVTWFTRRPREQGTSSWRAHVHTEPSTHGALAGPDLPDAHPRSLRAAAVPPMVAATDQEGPPSRLHERRRRDDVISAADRARTVHAAFARAATPATCCSGPLFPLQSGTVAC